MERYLFHLFVANSLLVIADASVGYRVVPFLLSSRIDEGDDPEAPERRTASVRRLLAGMVALYMFCSCYAYTRREPLFLLVVTVVLLLDLAIQAILFVKCRRGGEG